MLIVCPGCVTSYQIEPAVLGDTGRSVRCVRCRTVWFEAPRAPEAQIGAETPEPAMAEAAPSVHELPQSAAAADHPPSDDPSSGPPPPDAPDESAAAEHTLEAIQTETPEAEADAPQAQENADQEPAPAGQELMPVADSPALVPDAATDQPEGAVIDHEAAATPVDTVESFAARRARRSKRRQQQSSVRLLPALVVMLIAINSALIIWREDVVRVLPQTAGLYEALGFSVNLRGLAFEGLSTHTETKDGVTILVVEGTIANLRNQTTQVPRLRFSVRDRAGTELYAWTSLPKQRVLGGREKMTFRARLASPPPETHDLMVRFFNERDLSPGIP